MQQMQSKKGWRRVLYSRPSIVILVAFALWFTHLSLITWQKSRVADQNRRAAAEELAALQEKKVRLEAQVAALETPRGVEEEIRKKFSVARPGEKVITIIPEEIPPAPPDLSWWEKFKKFFTFE